MTLTFERNYRYDQSESADQMSRSKIISSKRYSYWSDTQIPETHTPKRLL